MCMLKVALQSVTLLVGILLGRGIDAAQSRNLLQNPNADNGSAGWQAKSEATVQPSTGGNLYFVVRNGGYFDQDVRFGA